jgi:CBS domain-containing protein
MFVHELMTTEVVSVRRDTHIKQVIRLLDKHNITSVPVMDAQDRVVGVVSEADLLRESVVHDPRGHMSVVPEEPGGVPRYVEEVMTNHPLVVDADADVADAVEVMTSTAIKSMPVVDDRGRLVGMISRHDVVRSLARADQLIQQSVDELLDELGVSWVATVDDGVVTVQGPQDWREHDMARTAASTIAGVRSVEIAEPAPDAARTAPTSPGGNGRR